MRIGLRIPLTSIFTLETVLAPHGPSVSRTMVSPDQPSQLPSTYTVMSLSVRRASDAPAPSSAFDATRATWPNPGR
jgi:hypothetical protein